MTVTLQPSEETTREAVAVEYASWGARLGAIAVDVLPGVAVAGTSGLLAFATAPDSALRWTFVAIGIVALFWVAVSRWVLPAVLGWSVGRSVAGIAVVRRDGSRPGIIGLFVRDVAHLLDTATAFVGWLWPLRDSRHRTFADLLLRTEVRRVGEATAKARKVAAWALIAAALCCVAGAGLGYATIYRQDRAVERARADVAEKGPRIVEQLLSYDVTSVKDDFARAQSLTTDDYRPLLIAQQQSIQNAGPVTNEYWSSNSAVLSVSPNEATMLVALQGQRGNDPKGQRFITATVRVEFVKSGGDWRVAHLTVLKRPQGKAAAR